MDGGVEGGVLGFFDGEAAFIVGEGACDASATDHDEGRPVAISPELAGGWRVWVSEVAGVLRGVSGEMVESFMPRMKAKRMRAAAAAARAAAFLCMGNSGEVHIDRRIGGEFVPGRGGWRKLG